MLFNSYVFLFLFLPVTLLGFHLIGKLENTRATIAWLVSASLFFYGWWNPAYLALLLFSTILNFSIGRLLEKYSENNSIKKVILTLGVIINLSILGYYKYANFFIDNLNAFVNTNIILYEVILPLGISFFTFQQISYLVDAYYKETKEYSFLNYCLFVTFFPQLIAGPIVHHKEMMPQFIKNNFYKLRSKNLAIGLTIFALGLFKKVVLADNIAVYSSPVFDAAEAGVILTFFEAWAGALAYTFQLYFDFSGYSDMAIGIARMFGIRLPINFNSPYKARSIIDFWRQWHITLSVFLRNYLYIPLGGNRRGKLRRYSNLMITMVIGGLWHGASWTFVLWGGLHGIYLIINHLWRTLFKNSNFKLNPFFSWMITFLAIVLSWVPFRSESFSSSYSMLNSMIGANGISLPVTFKNILTNYGLTYSENIIIFQGMFFNGVFGNQLVGIGLIIISFFIVTMFHNTGELISNNFLTKKPKVRLINLYKWQPTRLWSIFVSVLLIFSILHLSNNSEFLYFQF